MTALLDKLNVLGRPASLPRNSKRAMSANSENDPQTDSHDAPASRGVASQDAQEERPGQSWREETQLGSASTAGLNYPRPTGFTYAPGAKPLPPYTIRRGIGIGGFGEVYFAVSEAGKEVALKRIQRNLEVELRGVSHCLNLKHPNLVSLFDICRDEHDQFWVVMEYVAGKNLREVLDDSPSGLSVAEVNRWFSGIAAGVSHLHSAGLVHRDLKPGNVFDDLGVVKVGDYGLSKFISSSHRGGHTESVGTFHYMAPEVGRGQYGREIDIYALGVILYELLTGAVPFDGESCQEIIVKHMTATPELHGIAEPYRTVIDRCLQKDPSRRYSSVEQLLAALPIEQASPPADSIESKAVDGVTASDPCRALDQRRGKLYGDPTLAAASPVTADQGEPVARAIRKSLSDLDSWWSTLDRSPGVRMVLVLIAGFTLLINTQWLLPLLSFIAIVYVPYYIARQMLLQVHQQPSYAQAQRKASAPARPQRPLSRKQWRLQMREHLRAKPFLQRAAELNTSWIAAILLSTGVAFALGVIGLRDGPISATTIAPYGWLALVVLVASIGVLSLGKLWEREEGESLPRRVVLAGVGAGVGAVAFGLQHFLMIPVDEGMARDVDATGLPAALYRDGTPVLAAMMAHFAALFALLRWWKPVDPLRRTRLSLWAVAVAIVGEWFVHQFLPIPQPMGMLVAGGMAIAVQLSAPFIPKSDRQLMNVRCVRPTASGRVA